MQRRRTKKYREPEKGQDKKTFFTGYSLGELFDEEELLTFMDAARRGVIGEFHYATEPNPRYRAKPEGRSTRRTDNYIIGVPAKLSELARYVARSMHRSFITEKDLPDDLQGLRPKMIETVIWQAQFDLILLVLQTMRNREVWYDEGTGVWQICQSSMNEWCEYRKTARSLKVDDRAGHGRPRRDRGQIPEGASISLA